MKKTKKFRIPKKRKNRGDRAKGVVEKILKDRFVRRDVVRNKFEFFFPIYFHKYVKYRTAPFQEEIFRILEDITIKLAVIVAFRGSAKSTIITTAYVLWSILGIQQKKFIIIIGQTEQKARQYLMNIKSELENNELLKKDLGPFDEERNQWGATALIIKKLNAKIVISSTEQNIRGLRHGENRPDLIILDDVEDTQSVRNQGNRNKLFNWFASEVVPAGAENTRVFLVGNLLHDDSLVKRIQKKITLGEVSGIYREFPILNGDGSSAWAGRYPDMEAITEEKRKVMSEAVWSREYLLKIIDEDTQVIKREWIKYYDGLPPEPNFHTMFAIGVDLAISKEQTADYTAIIPVQMQSKWDEQMRIYVLPSVINRRMTSLETIEAIKAVSDSIVDEPKIYVESNGFQETIPQFLKDQRYDAEGVKSVGDKFSRLSAVSFLFQSGRVLFPREGCEDLINQLLGFGTEKNDDMVDAMSLLLTRLAREWSRPKAMFVENPIKL